MSTGINIAPSSDLTVGTTAVTSGTDTRVFFQAGGVVQQDANFTFDNTLKRLTLKAVGTASTDIPFQVLNSASTATPLYVRGTGNVEINPTTSGAGTLVKFTYDANGASNVTYGTPSGLVWHNFYTPYVYSALDGNNGYEGRIDLGRFNGTVRTRLACTGDSFFQFSNLVIGAQTAGARLDVRAQGALSTDIAFRVRNSADTADLISFRGDGSQWIQSVPFIHAGVLTGTTNATQSLHIGYNAAALNSASSNSITIGRGTGASLAGNNNVSIGNANNIGGFSSMLGIGLGVQMNAANTAFIGSETFPYSTMWVSTGGEVSSGANLRGLDFRVSGCVGGLTNQSASGVQVRFFSPNGTGSGAGSNIQFHVAPSNTGGSAFNRNIFSEMFTIRGEADGLNHYQLSTPRVPSASITDGYIQYSNDITAGNAAPHFRTEAGNIIKLYQQSSAGIATVGDLVTVLQNLGLLS